MALVKLRRYEFEARAKRIGVESQSAQARAIGVHVSIHHRALNGVQNDLSGTYVLGVLWLVGDDNVRRHIRSLFERDDCEQQAAS